MICHAFKEWTSMRCYFVPIKKIRYHRSHSLSYYTKWNFIHMDQQGCFLKKRSRQHADHISLNECNMVANLNRKSCLSAVIEFQLPHVLRSTFHYSAHLFSTSLVSARRLTHVKDIQLCGLDGINKPHRK